ncbi:histidine phosphatase family protein [uncultured Desulfobacter sp.]|uniref:histidine phosphatase family protein n=1 Tax=uncultured Desulfobacter sp. TaxID=240139 RepID=UPI0029F5955B|nr:histidine phosphatase family protein [uncultured Desulfobacter sp.]
METKYKLRSQHTIDLVRDLLGQGVDRISLIIRHSDRQYSDNPRLEPFMGLNDPGKQYAFDLGKFFPLDLTPVLFSSHFGRCIETAYLIDKGFTCVSNKDLPHNTINTALTPFYVKDIITATNMLIKTGSTQFVKDWFDKTIDESIMLDPEVTANRITDFMVSRLKDLSPGQAAVCVTHDWNIFPVKYFKLGLPHENALDAGYLDAVAFFEKGDRIFAAARQLDPVEIS